MHLESLVLIVVACLLLYEEGIQYIAASYIVIFGYIGLRMTSIALASVKAKWQHFFRALWPSLVLNSLLFMFLLLLNEVFNRLFGPQELLYLLVMGGLGVLFYGLLFLYMPLSQLSGEVQRTKDKIQRVLLLRRD